MTPSKTKLSFCHSVIGQDRGHVTVPQEYSKI